MMIRGETVQFSKQKAKRKKVAETNLENSLQKQKTNLLVPA